MIWLRPFSTRCKPNQEVVTLQGSAPAAVLPLSDKLKKQQDMQPVSILCINKMSILKMKCQGEYLQNADHKKNGTEVMNIYIYVCVCVCVCVWFK